MPGKTSPGHYIRLTCVPALMSVNDALTGSNEMESRPPERAGSCNTAGECYAALSGEYVFGLQSRGMMSRTLYESMTHAVVDLGNLLVDTSHLLKCILSSVALPP